MSAHLKYKATARITAAGLALVLLLGSEAGAVPKDAPPIPEGKAQVLAHLRGQMLLWEEMRTGKSERSKFGFDHMGRLIAKAGELKIRKAVPELVHLINNGSRETFIVDYAIKALGEIGDERAILPLLGELRWWSTHGRTIRALDALLEFERPMAPQLILALKGKNELRKRRALWAVERLARRSPNALLRVKMSQEEQRWFEVSEDLRKAVVKALGDSSSLLRYRALRTHLVLNGW
ncbi:MAG: hypothetical protein QGD94_06820, partial [Planctomycetia bacterium]|nr:hypothetical protein [Planctomycetia bacterium]